MASPSLSSGNAHFCSQTVSQKALLLFIFRFSAKRRVEWVWASEWRRGGRGGRGLPLPHFRKGRRNKKTLLFSSFCRIGTAGEGGGRGGGKGRENKDKKQGGKWREGGNPRTVEPETDDATGGGLRGI